MRGGDDILLEDRIGRIRWFLPEYIQPGTGKMSAFQCHFQRIFIYQTAPAEIDQKTPGFHLAEGLLIQNMMCIRAVGQAEHDKIRLLQQGGQFVQCAKPVQMMGFGKIRIDVLLDADQAYIKSSQAFCQCFADTA